MVAHNLPTYLTPFVGRTQEIAHLAASLADPTCRLITLVGPGGIGKTRLALEAVYSVDAATFANGIHFVPLQPVPSADRLVSVIANAMHFQFYAGGEPKTQLLDYFREKNLLLLFDNFEHLLDGVEIITDLLTAALEVKVLATSRERLNLSGETLFLVDGMPVPESTSHDAPLDYSAITLFVQSAKRVRADFKTEADDLQAITEICRLVGGMPLAILMAAAWVEVLRLSEIAGEIQRGLDLLETELRDIPTRQRSVRATFDYSWKRLSEIERTVFAMLSVFRGGFTREAAQVVTGASLKTLASLVNKSLVRVDTNGRYDLHELLRQYAEEQLRSTPEEATAREHHLAYFADFMAQCETGLYRGQDQNSQGASLLKVAAEKENVIVALYHAARHGNISAMNMILSSLMYFYEISGGHQEGETVFTNANLWLRANPQESADYQILSAWINGVRGRFISLQARFD